MFSCEYYEIFKNIFFVFAQKQPQEVFYKKISKYSQENT